MTQSPIPREEALAALQEADQAGKAIHARTNMSTVQRIAYCFAVALVPALQAFPKGSAVQTIGPEVVLLGLAILMLVLQRRATTKLTFHLSGRVGLFAVLVAAGAVGMIVGSYLLRGSLWCLAIAVASFAYWFAVTTWFTRYRPEATETAR
jgi:hypothetical protein